MEAIADRYAALVFDIDGVLVRLDAPIAGAAEALTALRERGIAVAFVTNNASRTPAQVAQALTDVGIPVATGDVVTSALAAAEMLAPQTRCLVIGMDGLREALATRGCAMVDEPAEAEAVVVGWDRNLTWDDLRRATLALAAGARFVATNGDVTYPASEGLLPGNGAVVAALAAASGRQPEIAGKPQPAMFEATARRLPQGRLLMVGDRPETDLVGAATLGWDTALVLTGVTAPTAASAVAPAPTWVLDDLGGLLQPPREQPAAAGGPRIRAATAADTEAVIALWEDAGMLAYTREPRRDVTGVLAHDGELFLVAELDGSLVGTLLGTCDGRRGWLQRLAVSRSHRREGVGRALVAEAERRLVARGVPQANLLVFASNAAAMMFWERLGYSAASPVALYTKRLGGGTADGC